MSHVSLRQCKYLAAQGLSVNLNVSKFSQFPKTRIQQKVTLLHVIPKTMSQHLYVGSFIFDCDYPCDWHIACHCKGQTLTTPSHKNTEGDLKHKGSGATTLQTEASSQPHEYHAYWGVIEDSFWVPRWQTILNATRPFASGYMCFPRCPPYWNPILSGHCGLDYCRQRIYISLHSCLWVLPSQFFSHLCNLKLQCLHLLNQINRLWYFLCKFQQGGAQTVVRTAISKATHRSVLLWSKQL